MNEALQQARELVASMEAKEKPEPGAAHGAKATGPCFLGAFTEADVARAADPRAAPGLEWRVAEWRFRRASLVALTYKRADLGAPPNSLEPRLFVLGRSAERLEVIARATIDLHNADCRNDSGESPAGDERVPELALDLTPYKIARDRTALGVRFICYRTFPAGEGSETRLLLFEQVESSLRPIFDEWVGGSNFDRPTGNETTSSGVVSVERPLHEGHFDLKLLMTTKTVEVDSTTAPAKARDSAERVERKTYVWQGARYVSAGEH